MIKSMTRENVGPGWGSRVPAIVFLNGHVVKLPSKCLCLYPKICAALNLDQRRFLVQWAVINVEAKDSPCECSALGRASLSTASPQDLETSQEKLKKECKNLRMASML